MNDILILLAAVLAGAQLSARERSVRDAIRSRRVEWLELRTQTSAELVH